MKNIDTAKLTKTSILNEQSLNEVVGGKGAWFDEMFDQEDQLVKDYHKKSDELKKAGATPDQLAALGKKFQQELDFLRRQFN